MTVDQMVGSRFLLQEHSENPYRRMDFQELMHLLHGQRLAMENADPEAIQSSGMPSEVDVAIHSSGIGPHSRPLVIPSDGTSAHLHLGLAPELASEVQIPEVAPALALDQFQQKDVLDWQIQVASTMGLQLLEVQLTMIEGLEAHSIAVERSAEVAS